MGQAPSLSIISGCTNMVGLFFFKLLLTCLTGPRKGWVYHPNGPCMYNGMLSNDDLQPFYFSEDHPSMLGWFKDMEIIICECGLWPKEDIELLAQCLGFHCPPGCADCCCWQILFLQPNFMSQKS